MYKIIGADQKEYGPVSAEEMRRWIFEGRANARTMVQLVGTADWKPLEEFPEFAQDLAQPPSFTPPPFSPSPDVSYQTREPANGLAIAGVVCGVLGLTCCGLGPLFSTIGLVCSCIALSRMRDNPEQQSGRAMAVAGIVLALLGYLSAFCVLVPHGFRRFPGTRIFHF